MLFNEMFVVLWCSFPLNSLATYPIIDSQLMDTITNWRLFVCRIIINRAPPFLVSRGLLVFRMTNSIVVDFFHWAVAHTYTCRKLSHKGCIDADEVDMTLTQCEVTLPLTAGRTDGIVGRLVN